MKNEVTCNVINDMLPLYADDVLSSDSKALVEEHLAECELCSAAYEQMKTPLIIEKNSDNERIKVLKNIVSVRRLLTAAVLCAAGIIVLVVSGLFLGRFFDNYSADGISKIRQFWCIFISFTLSVYILAGLCLYLKYYLKKTREGIAASVRKSAVAAYSVLLSLTVLVCVGYVCLFSGGAASSKDVNVTTEFQYCPGAYLDQEWAIHLDLMNGHAMNAITECQYEKTEYGERRLIGEVIYVRDVPLKLVLGTMGWTGGYACGEKPFDAENENFTFTIVYRDKTVVYDMRHEGLYEKQKNVIYNMPYAVETADTPDTAE